MSNPATSPSASSTASSSSASSASASITSPASASTSLIETELLRQSHYISIITWLTTEVSKLSKTIKPKDIDNMLLRYRFNLTATPSDDPVFVTSPSPKADAQFLKDCLYFRLGSKPLLLLEGIKKRFQESASAMTTPSPLQDKEVVIRSGTLIYGQKKFKDLKQLGKISGHHAFALHLRYEYLKLSNHGLARLYKGEKNSACEGFASAFNHYYDNWCGLFPDLETVFGSKGTFLEQKSFESEVVYINPPFDETVMAESMEHVYRLLAGGAENVFVFTLPDWPDYEPLLRLENSKWTHDIQGFKKGELKFVDHVTGKIIMPCDIAQLVLSCDAEKAGEVVKRLE